MKQIVGAILAGLLLVGPASAQFYTGNELLDLCKSSRTLVIGYSAGFVEGRQDIVVDADDGMLRTVKPTFCIPDGVTLGQITDVICKALTDNPANRHWSASVLARASINDAFPCQ